MAGSRASSNRIRAVDPSDHGSGDEHPEIDLNVNLDEESYMPDLRGLDPYTRMILGHGTGGGSSSSSVPLSNYIDLNDGGGPGHDIGMMVWPYQPSSAETAEAETRQQHQMESATAPHLSSFRSMSAAVVGRYDGGRAGPSSGSGGGSHVNQHHLLKREGPEDASGVGIRIGASSDQRNVRQRFSYENQQNLPSGSNSNHAQTGGAESPLIVLHLQGSSAYPAPTMQDPSSSRARAATGELPEYPAVPDDVIPLRMRFPSGAGRGNMAQTQTHVYQNYEFHGSNNNASSSASSGPQFEHFHGTYVPAVLGHVVQLNAGPFGNQYRRQTSNNQFGQAAGPLQDGGFLGSSTPPIVGFNRRGEPLTGAARVRRTSNVQAPPVTGAGAVVARNSNVHAQIARLLGRTVLTGSGLGLGSGSGSNPVHEAGSIYLRTVPLSEPVPTSRPTNWLPTYLPALQTVPSLEPANWLPAYLAPAPQAENNFTPVTWDDFEDDEDEDEDDLPYDVESMSYEELLALEDHIGNVSTGLSEETIKANLKPKKYSCFKVGPPGEEEICCICQEGYEEGEMITRLSCRHEFHFDCIKQWLVQKNSCPMCKKTAIII